MYTLHLKSLIIQRAQVLPNENSALMTFVLPFLNKILKMLRKTRAHKKKKKIKKSPYRYQLQYII